MKTYQKRHHQFPLRLPHYGPQTKLESTFDELQDDCTPPHLREQKANNWISNTTWKLTNHSTMLGWRGMLTQRGGTETGEGYQNLIEGGPHIMGCERCLRDGELPSGWGSKIILEMPEGVVHCGGGPGTKALL